VRPIRPEGPICGLKARGQMRFGIGHAPADNGLAGLSMLSHAHGEPRARQASHA
jgi:hypothetical protein